MRSLLFGAFAASVVSVAATASAQTAPDTAAIMAPAPAPELAPPRFGRTTEHSVGMRAWLFNVPSWMVGLFAEIQGDWSGPLNLTIGPEYTYRRGGIDIVVGLQYTGLGAEPGFIHGNGEPAVATERVQSALWAVYGNALFLWHHRFNDWFELQYGVGVGLGYVGGDLYRTQVYDTGGGSYVECDNRPLPGQRPAVPTRDGYCDTANNHYVYSDGTRYSEGRLTDTNSGSIPPVVPWLSLPHLALHFRPHRNVDIRLDGGFALIGFYGGLAAHYVF